MLIGVMAANPLIAGSRVPSELPLQSSTESTIFFDDFESYAVNTFPLQGGWEITDGGPDSSPQNHVITDSKAFAGSKSLQLMGSVLKRFATTASIIGYEFAFLGFVAGAYFKAARYMLTAVEFKGQAFALDHVTRVSLGSFQPQQWQTVKAVLDRASNTYNVWINGVLKASSLHTVGGETGQLDSLELLGGGLASGGARALTCIDNVRVFAVSPAGFSIDPAIIGAISIVAAAVIGATIALRKSRLKKVKEAPPTTTAKETKFCISCRTELPLDAKFCDNCGASQERARSWS